MFKRVLIANRGEIAARVARTCKRLGMEAIAVYSDLDQDGLHCQACDEAVRLGPADPHESYLNIEAILAAAAQSRADAIHPGYGMLSESPAFARAVRDAGIGFVGPGPDTMERLLDRIQTRALAIAAGVRVLPASETPAADAASARSQADELGYPVVVKPVRAGGGIGPSLVSEEAELEAALAHASERAAQVFGDSRVYLERAIDRPRHVEVQVVADENGEVIALGDRECSIQRNSFRLLDEAPAPSFQGSERAERTRDAVWDSATRVAKEAGLNGVGTVEFLLDTHGEAYFLEVRPRLQVAHGITEMCTGVDLVEAQLLLAAGKPLPDEVARALPSGHAMEVRICVELGARGNSILPAELHEMRWPNASPGRLRIEASVQSGSKISTLYDTMLAKVISYAPTRHAALLLLDRVLSESVLSPVPTNAAFLRRILGHESFRAGQYDTSFVDQVSKRH
jgi:acetyl/propionyl-CoA carboxylase alpha subunit